MNETVTLFGASSESQSEGEATQENQAETQETSQPSQEQTELPSTEGTTEATPEEEKWWLAEGIQGTGPKPEFINTKTFGTALDQAKAQVEARKLLGGFTGAPKDGYTVPTIENVTINTEDPLFVGFAEIAQERNMSQDCFENIVKKFVEFNPGMKEETPEEKTTRETQEAETNQTYIKEQLEVIGPNGAAEVKNLAQWMCNNSAQEYHKTFEKFVNNAEIVKALMSLRTKLAPTPIDVPPPAPPITEAQILEDMRDPRYGKYGEDDFTNRVEANRKELYAYLNKK